jgi:uncharacterized protein YceH (UPF0502 family)
MRAHDLPNVTSLCKPSTVTDGDIALDLTVSQARVLGSLLEKELTTPDAYPMTLNALVAACCQTSNRDPVLHLDATQVETAALALKSKGLLRVVHPGAGERATRYRQVADEALGLRAADRALLSLLLVRGAQTAASLLARSERLHRFGGAAEVEATLGELAAREVPLVARLDPLPGQREARWIQLLEAGAAERAAARPRGTHEAAHSHGAAAPPALASLEARLHALESRLDAVVEALGDLVPPSDPTTPEG